MPRIVSAEDLATYLRKPVNTSAAEQLLDLVEAEVLAAYGADDPPTALRPVALLARVSLGAAARAYGNPEDYDSETVGPYTWRRTGGLLLTDDERDLIRRAAADNFGTTTGGVVSVPLIDPDMPTVAVASSSW